VHRHPARRDVQAAHTDLLRGGEQQSLGDAACASAVCGAAELQVLVLVLEELSSATSCRRKLFPGGVSQSYVIRNAHCPQPNSALRNKMVICFCIGSLFIIIIVISFILVLFYM
jgi:hypothetical protein